MAGIVNGPENLSPLPWWEGIKGRGMVRQAHHDHPESIEGSPSPPAYRQAGNPLPSREREYIWGEFKTWTK